MFSREQKKLQVFTISIIGFITKNGLLFNCAYLFLEMKLLPLCCAALLLFAVVRAEEDEGEGAKK